MTRTYTTRQTGVIAVIAVASLLALILSMSFVSNAYAVGIGTWQGGDSYVSILDKSKKVTTLYKGKKYDDGVRRYFGEGELKALKSSNKKVAKVSYVQDGDSFRIDVKIKKAGTTTITYKHNNKKHKVKFVAQKFVNPFKSFKVGNVEHAKNFNLDKWTAVGYKDHMFMSANNAFEFNGKVNAKMKKNWKITSINPDFSAKKVKNKGKVDKAQSLVVEVKNKKTKQKENFVLYATKSALTATGALKSDSTLQAGTPIASL